MKVIKVSRSQFPPFSMYSWMNFFRFVLDKKYQTLVDAENPDVVFWTNLSSFPDQFDYYLGTNCRPIHTYPDTVKKVFITGEQFSNYQSILDMGENYYAMGFEKFEHPRYLRFPTYVLDCWVLYNEGRMFDTPFAWLTDPKDPEKIFAEKTRFCSIVQASHTDLRAELFDKLSAYKPIKSSGPWRCTIEPHEAPKKGEYLKHEFFGRIDGLTYRSKIEFFRDCKFNIAYQLHSHKYMTQEKLLHAMAANTIPIFNGNPDILDEGFNPASFINRHNYETVDHMVEHIIELDRDDWKWKRRIREPWFIDNKLTQYFNCDYVLEFFERMFG